MCAIIGHVGKKIDPKRFEAARDTMARRGPDDSGAYYDPVYPAALGNRRLSIIDLSPAGHQPMFSADGRYVITFNGEIFNYVELKRELENHRFRSDSDTEVLLAAYVKWGKDCLKKFNGQFAFAIYDTKEHELFAARDHLGIKPFFYTLHEGALLFASEIKALLALGAPARPNDEIVYEFLEFGYYDHRDETFFSGIRPLPPGHSLTYRGGNLSIEKYWDLADVDPDQHRSISEADAAVELRRLIQDAIRLQFRSDVPVGLNLTSGLDSGTLLYFSRRVYPAELHTFTGCIEDDTYDECRILSARLTNEERSLWHTGNLKPENVFQFAEELLAVEDQPYGGMPAIQFFNLYRETYGMTKVKVVIEGQGMDEILAGYKYFLPSFYKDALTRLDVAAIQRYVRSTREKGKGTREALGDLFRYLTAGGGRSQDLTKESGFDLLAPDFKKRFSADPPKFPRPFHSRLLDDQYRDIRHTKIPRILRSNDHFSMAFSKEVRVPYLDWRLVEFAFTLPPHLKIRGTTQKYLLRTAMRDYLPPAVQEGSKVAFGAFQTNWFRKYFRDEVESLLGSASFRSRPYFNQSAVTERLEAFFGGAGDNSFFLWQMINLELWLRRYID